MIKLVEPAAEGMIYVLDYDKMVIDEYTAKITFEGDWFYYYGNGEYGCSVGRPENPAEIFDEAFRNFSPLPPYTYPE